MPYYPDASLGPRSVDNGDARALPLNDLLTRGRLARLRKKGESAPFRFGNNNGAADDPHWRMYDAMLERNAV